MTTIIKDNSTISKTGINNNNQMTGKNVMPMKSQTTSPGNHFSMMRQIFQRTPKTNPENDTTKRGKNALYQDNSLYLIKKKAQATGKTQYSSTLKYNSNPTNDVKNATKRVRSSGSVAPPKKGYVN